MASRDFLGGFGGKAAAGAPAECVGSGAAAGASEEIELSLGLSLGGCFSADRMREEKKLGLARSSSIASICSLPGSGGDDHGAVAPPPAELMRTTSLPTENEEDRFRRRAMQCQRRLAVKRKRLERRNSMNSVRASAGAGRDEAPEAGTLPSGFQLRRPVAASPGSTSSSLPEQGGANAAEAKSPSASAMNTSSDNISGQNSSLHPSGSGGRPPNGATSRDQPPPAQPQPLRTLRSLTMRTSSTGDVRRSMMEDMPMVSTRADGPNGRKVDGFLYKYRSGEEVRIVCVCHGSFLTPAEFVRHGGGGDVANPLRHIVVNHQESLFL